MSDSYEIPLTDDDLYPSNGAVEEAMHRLLVFRLGQEWYAVPAESLREVVPVGPMTYLPCAPAHVIGITNLRGDLVSVIDPTLLLGLAHGEVTEHRRLVVVEAGAARAALMVDEVSQLIEVPAGRLEPPLTTLDQEHGQFISQTVPWRERLVGLLRVDRVVGVEPPSNPA